MELLQLLPLLGVALLFYVLILRPAQRRSRELASMQSSLTVGDDVVLTSGVHGTLTGLGDDHVFVEIAEGVVIKVARGAIGNVRRDASEETDLNHTTSDTETPGTDSGTRSEDN
ncbi:preprotein translocase subunit YajC [Nocardioides salsibiostraticola]